MTDSKIGVKFNPLMSAREGKKSCKMDLLPVNRSAEETNGLLSPALSFRGGEGVATFGAEGAAGAVSLSSGRGVGVRGNFFSWFIGKVGVRGS